MIYKFKKLYKMDIENLKVKSAGVLGCPPDRSPIFFVNVLGEIKDRKTKLKVGVYYTAEKIVVKGTLEQIQKSDQTKKQFLREFFKEAANTNKKANEFDLSKVTILQINIIRSLGYGIKSN